MSTDTSFGELRQGVFPPLQQDVLSDEYTEPFWQAAAEDRLVVPRCTKCGTFRLPPLPVCHECQSEGFDWFELPGTGTVYSFTVVRHPLHPGLADICPYVSGIVELDGTPGVGARLLVNIVDCEPAAVTIGTPVRIIFDHSYPRFPVPRARPIGAG